MRRLLSIFLLVPTLVCGSWASSSDVESNTRMLQDLGERSDGTDAERMAFDLIAGYLESLDIEYVRTPLDRSPRGHSFSENLIAEIPGSGPNRFILAAPVDGGAFSVSLLMEMASLLTINPPENTVVLAFLGAERGESRYHPYGSRQVVDTYNIPGGTFALYLESESIPESWQLKPGGDGTIAPYWLVKISTESISANSISYRLRGTDFQVARMGLQGDIGALRTWTEAGIPALLLEGNGEAGAAEKIRMIDRILVSIIGIDRLTTEIPINPQSTYIFLRPLPGLRPRIVPELPYVSVFLLISALLMFVILLRYRTVRMNLKRFARFWWTWPLLLMMVFLFLFLSTLIIEETILIADFPEIWTFAPGIFVFFKLTIAAALSLNFILITRGLPLPRNPHFYSYAAVLTSILASLVFISLNITLAAYSLWAVVNLLLFVSTRNPRWKNIFLYLSLVPYAAGLAVIIGEPYTEIIHSLLLSRINSSLMLTLLLYPVILIIASLSYHRHHYQRTRSGVLTSVATLTITLSALITLFWILSLSPFDTGNPQSVELIDHINLKYRDRRVEILSPAPIGNAELELDGRIYPLENLGRHAEVRMPFNRTPLAMDSESRTFLGRRTVRTTISGEADPKRLSILLRSEKPYTLHEANFPFEMAPSGTSAEFFIGENPPFPITLRFTVNGDASLVFSAVGTWKDPEDPPSINGTNLTDRTTRIALLESDL